MTRSKVNSNDESVKRRYASPARDEQAIATRRRIRDAAERLLLDRGYAGTSMSAIAEAAGVSRPTVFNVFGSKAELLKEVADVRLAGDDAPIDLLSRSEGQRILTAKDPRELLRLQARFGAEIMERVAPVMVVIAEAAAVDTDVASLMATQEEGRLFGMGAAVDRIVELGALRSGISPLHAKESLWLLGGLEPWLLARRRGWSRRRYEEWFFTCACALLLDA